MKAIVTVSGGDTYEPHCRSNPVCIQIYVLWQSVVRQQMVRCCVSAPRFPGCYADVVTTTAGAYRPSQRS